MKIRKKAKTEEAPKYVVRSNGVAASRERQMKIAMAIVESGPFYGYRTTKGLLKYCKVNKSAIGDGIRTSRASRYGYVGSKVRELREAMQPRIEALAQTEPVELERIARDIGAIRCLERYGSTVQRRDIQESKPALDDDHEREVILPKGVNKQRFFKKWLKESKKQRRLRNKEQHREKIKARRAWLSVDNYIDQIRAWNKSISEANLANERRVNQIIRRRRLAEPIEM